MLPVALAASFAAGVPKAEAGVQTGDICVQEILQRMAHWQQQQQATLDEYTAVRKYTLKNSHFKQDPEMTAQLSFRKGEGKTFKIVSLDGAQGMSKKIFDRLLEAETDASSKSRQDSAINAGNYDFQLLGSQIQNGRPCYLLQIHPKSKKKYLIDGRAWVDKTDFAVIRLEGHPAANVSFWVGKPYIVQEFQKVGDHWLASKNNSVSQCRFFGATTLTIEGTNFHVPSDEAIASLSAKAKPAEQ